MPPTVLTSDDRADVQSALASQPKFTDPQAKALYNWVLRLVTALFNYVTYFLGDNSDRTDDLIRRVQALEEQSQAPAPQPTIPSTITPQQPSHPSRRQRCKRCHALMSRVTLYPPEFIFQNAFALIQSTRVNKRYQYRIHTLQVNVSPASPPTLPWLLSLVTFAEQVSAPRLIHFIASYEFSKRFSV